MSASGSAAGGPDISTLTRGAPRSDVPRPRMRWTTRVVLPLGMLLGAALLLLYAARGALAPAIEVRVVPVVVRSGTGMEDPDDVGGGSARGGPVEVVQAPGWIEPDPFAIGVPVLVEGVVREVLVLEGQRVEEGQVVARLVDDDLRLAERTARAEVSEREAELARARAAVESARAQERVQRAMLEELRDELERKSKLVRAGGASAGEVRRMEIRLGGLEAAVAQAASAIAEAEAAVTLAEAAVETSRAALAEASLRLERAQVKSPAAGVVLARLVSPGARVPMQGDPSGGNVVKLYEPGKLQARVDVPLSDAAKIGIGTSAQVTTEALPNQTFQGKVTRIVHQADIQRNTVQFKVAIENPAEALKPEMLCRVRFSVDASGDAGASAGDGEVADQALLLPERAARERRNDRAVVWLASPGGQGTRMVARRVEVSLGGQSEGNVLVLDGLKPGDRAIVEASAELREGARVRITGEAEVQ